MRAIPIARHGKRGANAGALAMSAMGSHLSGKVQAGRCRVRRGLREDVVAIVGVGPGTGRRGSSGRLRSRRVESVMRPALRRPAPGGRVSVATSTRIAASA